MRNNYMVKGNVVLIEITHRNKPSSFAKIDVADLVRVAAYGRYSMISGRAGKEYVYGDQKTLLQRVVMATPADQKCLFRNGDTLDCRRANLVNAKELRTLSRNSQPNKGRYIYRRAGNGRYWVKVTDRCRKLKYLGSFITYAEAVAVRDRWLAKAAKRKR